MKKDSLFADSKFWLWLTVSVAPFALILVSFVVGEWTWGLMDDHCLVLEAQKLGRIDFVSPFTNMVGSFQIHGGRGLRFTYETYIQIFYFLFKGSPVSFYVFHTFLLGGVLLLWGYVASLWTREKFTFVLVLAIAMGCYPLYEGFFYLSVQEILGAFFLGLGLVFLVKGVLMPLENKRNISPWHLAGLLGSLFFLIGSKETFTSSIAVISAASLVWGFVNRKRTVIVWAAGTLVLTIAYALWLKIFVQGAYSSSYHFSDIPRLAINVSAWVRQVFLGHMPWLFLAIFLVWFYRVDWKEQVFKNILPLGVGVALYLSYWGIILPWSAVSYMAIPLAIFFSFTMAIGIAPFLKRAKEGVHIGLITFVLIFNMWTACNQLQIFERYNSDTIYLLKWINNDPYIQAASVAGKQIGCNGYELSDAIFDLSKLEKGNPIGKISYTPKVRDIVFNKEMLFYIYNTRYGDQDLRRLKDMWTPVFMSKNWIVFRRNY